MTTPTEIEMQREAVAACKKMCAERFPLRGDFAGWLGQAYAYHASVKLLHEAEDKLRALVEKARAAR